MLSPFCRLKKNSLKLLTSIYTVEFVEIFEEIKNKKLFLCYLKEELKIFKEINVKSDTVFLYVAKINKTQIVTISYHSLFNIWDLSTGICIKSVTLQHEVTYINRDTLLVGITVLSNKNRWTDKSMGLVY